MKRIIFLLVAAGLFLALGSSSVLAEQTVCQGSYANCNAACVAAGGTCFDRSCSWSSDCPSGSVSQWCTTYLGWSLCDVSGTSGAYCKCTSGTICVPKTCADIGKFGVWSDGCGGTIDCGTCPSLPLSCSAGKNCGTESGCWGTIPCGTCTGGQVCYGSPSGTCGDPHWTATGTNLSVPASCAALTCQTPTSCNSDGSCGYSTSPAGTPCTGGYCYGSSCDTSPPTTSISLSPALPDGINGWYVSQVTASITCNDVGSGCQKITFTTDNGAHWYDASASSTPFTYGVGPLGDGTYNIKAYSTDNAGNVGSTTSTYSISIDNSAPSVSVAGAPAGWQSSASASVSCYDSGSGCGTSKLKTYSSNPGSCSSNYNDYPLANPSAISSHAWVCAYAEDNAGNAGFSSPVEFTIDGTPPQINPYGVPFSPCTLNPVNIWIDCSAAASINSYPPEGCVDSESGCKPSSYGFIKYYSDPGTCPSSKAAYSSNLMQLDSLAWVCAYAEDNAGNAGVSSPTKFMVNRTFVIEINARAYGEIDVPSGTEVKGYLCEPSQYYCNQDAKYLASGSGIVDADKRFRITFVKEFVRGTKYKVGLQTEKGYVESEFVA